MFYKTKKENIMPNTSKIIMTHGLKYEQKHKTLSFKALSMRLRLFLAQCSVRPYHIT